MKRWEPSAQTFDRFLGLLDADRDIAGQRYELLRRRIIKFFEWRACKLADNLADETLDRVMRRLETGAEVTDPFKYAHGVARFVLMESTRSTVKEDAFSRDIPAPEQFPADAGDERMAHLKKCLDKLPARSRIMVLRYHQQLNEPVGRYRESIADELGMSLNALRIKVFRIRTKLEHCVRKGMSMASIR